MVLLIAGPAADTPAGAQPASIDRSKVRVLVYTKNGEGYVHDNIPASIEAVRAIAREHRFAVDVSDDPAVFAGDTLRKYGAVVFSNTNNVVFDTDAQRVALMRYVQAGGGFAAIHSASGSERTWKWFAGLLGGTSSVTHRFRSSASASWTALTRPSRTFQSAGSATTSATTSCG
jgi:type 1 glutamine amidotransferase